MSNETDNLTKVHIDLPNHWWRKGESMWAKSLGGDLFEIQNVPFCAYGLNCLDVVLATSDKPDLKPEIRSVVRRSGNRTLRIYFSEDMSKEQQHPHLKELESMDAWIERGNETFVCVNVNPTANYESICGCLTQKEAEGVLTYETCEVRVAGSFDDRPSDDEV